MKKIKGYIAWALGFSMILANLEPMAATMNATSYTMDILDEDIWDEDIFDEDLNVEGAEATPADATASDATPANALLRVSNSIGDIWNSWSGKTSFEFLSGSQGKGSEDKPYLIKNREQLMGLSELAAMGMTVQEGTGLYAGNYSGSYFALSANIDLQGVDWIPIGFYQDSSQANGDVTNAFTGHFDGKGYTIKNLKLNTLGYYNYIGLFGSVKDAEVKNLTIVPNASYSIVGGSEVGVLAGSAEDSSFKDIAIKNADISASGIAGGIAGSVTNTTIENIICDNVKVNVQTSTDTIYVGGITGQATGSLLIDCSVTTGNSLTAKIQGKGYVGGITGNQNGTDIYNVYVSGTIGGKDSTAIGGITGEYVAGKLKVARFDGTIANSYLGNKKEGTFIGTRRGAATNYNFVDDVAYLFADSLAKITANVCGSGISDDNDYTYAAKIGYYHADNNYYTLVQGNNTQVSDQYYYEVLEEGILSILDKEDLGNATIDHIAPNATGKPVRGYLVTVEQIDTIANGQYYDDVAAVSVQGSSQYCKTIDKEHRGAIAYGDNVYLTTAPNNTESAKYQMDGVPFYKMADGQKTNTTYDKSSKSYTFRMPAEDIVISAIYKKVAVSIEVNPSTYNFVVTQTRTGNRKNPTKTTIVKNSEGKLIATYINGQLEQGTQVQPVSIKATIDSHNDVSDNKVKWSIDDSNLINLAQNADEESDGYTEQSASLTLNMDAQFFNGILTKLEKEQTDAGYVNKIPNTIFGAGHQSGGVAVLTAQTRPATSFEGKPCTANSRINVTFQVLDNTYVALEGAVLDKSSMEFIVTRTLEGNRSEQTETLSVTAPQMLTATFTPNFFSQQNISWISSDAAILNVDGSDKDALITAFKDAKWIKDITAIDDAIRANDKNAVLSGSGERHSTVTVVAEDKLGNQRSAVCDVTITFKTEDKTYFRKPSTGGGGGGGGGSSSGGGGSSAVTPIGTTKSSGAPAGAVTGTWVQDATGQWLFTGNERTYANEWAYIHNPYAAGENTASWFRFNEQGYMITGWYTDPDGNTYFLHDISDGTQGTMYLGWNWIKSPDGVRHCYFFNNSSEGIQGKMFVNTVTQDGYQVNAQGEWILEGIVQTMN